MLPLTALPAAQTPPATTDAPASNGDAAQNGVGFGALLAALGQGAGQQQPPADPVRILPEAELPGGGILPDGGKDLPDGKTDGPVDTTLAEALPETVLLGLPMIAGSAMTNPEVAVPPAQTASDAPRQLPAPQASQRPAAAAEQPSPALPVLEVTAADQPIAARLLPEAVRAAAPARPGTNLRIRTGDPVAEVASRAAPTETVLAGTTVSSAVPVAPSQPLTTPSAAPAPSAPNPSAPNPSTTPLPLAEAAQRPQDFGQLIDRLVAAREAAAPQAASFSLAHAEFGRVDLTFASDGQGLSVNLSSPDPDFARAVQAAAQPATTGDPGSNGSRQPGQSEARHDGLPGQSQGQGGEQRQGRPADRPPAGQTPHANHTMPRPDRSNPETGIFA